MESVKHIIGEVYESIYLVALMIELLLFSFEYTAYARIGIVSTAAQIFLSPLMS